MVIELLFAKFQYIIIKLLIVVKPIHSFISDFLIFIANHRSKIKNFNSC